MVCMYTSGRDVRKPGDWSAGAGVRGVATSRVAARRVAARHRAVPRRRRRRHLPAVTSAGINVHTDI